MEIKMVNTKWTDEQVIDVVRKQRNDLIKDFLDERHLKDYLSHHFGVHELNNIKIEFIKKDLKELLISPVNINHYHAVITHVHTTDSATLTEANQGLFYKELEVVFKRYIYQ